MILRKNVGIISVYWRCFGKACTDVPRRFIVREFTFSEEAIGKQREELETADTTEKELWVSGPAERA